MKGMRHDQRAKNSNVADGTPAAAIADAASPVASVAKRKIPSSIRGRVSTVAKAHEGRLSNFATGPQSETA